MGQVARSSFHFWFCHDGLCPIQAASFAAWVGKHEGLPGLRFSPTGNWPSRWNGGWPTSQSTPRAGCPGSGFSNLGNLECGSSWFPRSQRRGLGHPSLLGELTGTWATRPRVPNRTFISSQKDRLHGFLLIPSSSPPIESSTKSPKCPRCLPGER